MKSHIKLNSIIMITYSEMQMISEKKKIMRNLIMRSLNQVGVITKEVLLSMLTMMMMKQIMGRRMMLLDIEHSHLNWYSSIEN
jgi:hypothetical protein